MPPGLPEFKLNQADPSFAQLKAIAHKHGLTENAVSDLVGVYAANQVGLKAAQVADRQAQIDSLGSTGPARVDNVARFLVGSGLSVLVDTIQTAAQLQAWESHITKLTSQGGASFSQSHRVPPETDKIPGFDNMSFAQQRYAQDQLRARKTA